MVSEWREVPIGELCLGIYDGPHATPAKTNVGPVFLGISNLTSGRLNLAETEHLSEEDFLRWTRRVTPQETDIVFSYETRLGEAAILPNGLRCCLGRRMALMRVNPEKADPHFLLYAYLGNQFQETIRARTVHGSTVDRIPLIDFPSFLIQIPPLSEQKKIGKILRVLDEKIELNRRMNATLEAMAQALFKSWFVDFDFPDFDGNLIDGLPKGWKKTNLEELIDTVSITHKFPKDQIIFLNTSDISDGQVLHRKSSDVSTLPGQAKKSIQKNDILYSEIRPANNRHAFIDFDAQDFVVSTKLMVLRAKGLVDPVVIYYYLKRDEVVNWLQILAESRSGTFPQITFQQVKSLEMIMPDEKSLKTYTATLKAYFEKVNSNHRENKKLSEIRDVLLPKLISGQLRIPEAEAMAEAAL